MPLHSYAPLVVTCTMRMATIGVCHTLSATLVAASISSADCLQRLSIKQHVSAPAAVSVCGHLSGTVASTFLCFDSVLWWAAAHACSVSTCSTLFVGEQGSLRCLPHHCCSFCIPFPSHPLPLHCCVSSARICYLRERALYCQVAHALNDRQLGRNPFARGVMAYTCNALLVGSPNSFPRPSKLRQTQCGTVALSALCTQLADVHSTNCCG